MAAPEDFTGHRSPQQRVGDRSTRVLIVDDLVDIRYLLRLNLEHRGFVVTEAPDPEVARARAAHEPPDGIIMDLDIPGFDAVGAVRGLRDLVPQAGILVISASPQQEDVAIGALAAGADAYFDKTGGFDALVGRLSTLLAGPARDGPQASRPRLPPERAGA